MIVNEFIKKIEDTYDSKSLGEIESVLRDPFGDTDFEADPAFRPVFDALARQEKQIKAREEEGLRHLRVKSQETMLESLKSTNVMGTGITLKRRNNRGKIVNVRGRGFDIPSGSSVSLSDEGNGVNDAYQSGMDEFVNKYIKDHLSANYVDPKGKSGNPQDLTHREVVEEYGIVPGDAARIGLENFLNDAAGDGSMGKGDIAKFGQQFGLPKTVVAEAQKRLRATEKADAGESPSQTKSATTLKKSIKADVLKDTEAKMKSLYQLGYLSGKRDAGAYTGAVQGEGLAGMPVDGSGGGGNGGNGGGSGAGAGAGNGDESDKPTADQKQKVRDENRQHRDEVTNIKAKMRVEDKQQRDEASVIRENKRRDEADARKGVTAENRQQRDESWYARDQKRAEKEEQKHTDFAKKTLAGAQEQERKSTEAAQKKGEKSGAVGNGFEPFMAARLFDNFSASVRAGLQVGNAAGAVAQGIEHMVLGAAGAFVHAGESALALFLSPFGRTGGSLARMAGAIGGALISGLTAGGGLAVAGIKLGVGLIGGLIAGVQSIGGAALGAALGSAGGPAGMLAGAVIGSGLVARIQSVFSGLMSTIGGAVGQALASIGTAFGELGNAVGGFLSSVKDVLSDLVETGVKMGQTALSTQRNSGMSGQASSDAVGLSQVLTGGPGAFNGVFSNVAMMRQYMDTRATAYGAKGTGSFVDNLPGLYQKYQAMGDGPTGALRRRVMLSIVAPGAQDTIGGLFSLGRGVVQKAVQTAKAVALTPAENRQNAMLGFDLNVAQAQIDRLKTKLLTDLMPALNGILGVFTKWFTGHEGAIVGSLERFGRWIYVMLPEYFRQGANAFFELGKAIGGALPGVALFIDKFYFGFATLFNALQKGLGGLMVALTPLISLIPGVGPVGALALGKQGAGMLASPGLDPTALDGMFSDKDGVFGKNGALNGENVQKWASDHKAAFDQGFENNAGSISQRNKAYDGFSQYFNNNRAGAAGSADLNIKADITVHPDQDSFARLERRVGDQTIKRLVRADQRS